MSFAARYDGRCASCHEEIFEGDLITMTDDGALHEDCAPVVEPPQHPICDRCWLAHPEGACDR